MDVAIVGGGITGLTAAALLTRAGKKVALLEMQPFGQHGTTHRTTAHLTAILDTEYRTLIRKFNHEAVRSAVAANQSAIDLIESLSRDLGIECEFVRVDGFRFTENEKHIDKIEHDAKEAQRLGLSAELTDRIPLPFPVQRGYRVPRQAMFHPLKFVIGLARYVTENGGRIFDKSMVEDFEDGSPCTLRTSQGTVTATDIILATHTPMGLWTTVQTRLVAYRSYVMAVQLADALEPGLYWDDASPYHYIRPFHSDGRVAIIGGADHKTGDKSDPQERFDQLEQYARERFPNIQGIDFRWSAEFFEPADGFPYIGRGAGTDHVYFGTGYAGTGMTYGVAAAMLMSDLILGRENPCADLFDPRRIKPLASAKITLEEAATSVKGLITDRIFRVKREDVGDLSPGEGKVISARGKSIAVFRDDAGELHALSASCTHLGCVVAWNGVEKTWDCPCHGSIFKATGEPATGPACKSLQPRELDED